MRAVRNVSTVVALLAGAGVLAGCGGGSGQVGSIAAGENPPAETAPASTSSASEIARKRAQEHADDPRTAEEIRREEAREAAQKVKEIAEDIKNGVTQARFTMPALVGRNLQVAQDMLQARGSYLLDQVDATSQDRFQLIDSQWQVCHQSPQAGAHVLKTKIVRLETVKLDENCP